MTKQTDTVTISCDEMDALLELLQDAYDDTMNIAEGRDAEDAGLRDRARHRVDAARVMVYRMTQQGDGVTA